MKARVMRKLEMRENKKTYLVRYSDLIKIREIEWLARGKGRCLIQLIYTYLKKTFMRLQYCVKISQ